MSCKQKDDWSLQKLAAFSFQPERRGGRQDIAAETAAWPSLAYTDLPGDDPGELEGGVNIFLPYQLSSALADPAEPC